MPKNQEAVASAWRSLIEALGYDLENPHLKGSPERVARFLCDWHTIGQDPPVMTTFPNAKYDAVVVTSGIRFHSLCAHHGLPFFGEAAVGYIPGANVVGLSKLARAVDHFSRQFQTQEDITQQVALFLQEKLKPAGVGVVLRAEHLCMSLRGIQKPGHQTTTSAMLGAFRKEPEARAELLTLMEVRR